MSSKQKYSQIYFKAFQLIGDSTELQIFRMLGNEVVEKTSYNHADYDGIAAVVDLAKKHSSKFTAPAIKYFPQPSFLKCLQELARWYVTFFPFKASFWKKGQSGKRASAWTQICLPQGLSSQDLNTLLLLSLDQTAREYLQKPRLPRMWMIPVALYPKIDHSVDGGNFVSFIDMKIKDESTQDDLKAQMGRWLKQRNYWGTLLTIKPAGFFKAEAFAKYLKYAHLTFRRTGTLTNMGSWSIPELPQDEWWVFGEGMVAQMNPLSATALMINGRLGISVITHESLGWNEILIQKFLDGWKNRVEQSLHKSDKTSIASEAIRR